MMITVFFFSFIQLYHADAVVVAAKWKQEQKKA
jgi:hypothetical protein